MLLHVAENVERNGLCLNGGVFMSIMPPIRLSGMVESKIKFSGMQKGTRFGITVELIQVCTNQGFLASRGPCLHVKETEVANIFCVYSMSYRFISFTKM